MVSPTFGVSSSEALTGRYIVTFQKTALNEGLSLLRDQVGLGRILPASDFADSDVPVDELDDEDGAVFEQLDVGVVNCVRESAERIEKLARRSAILSIEPEHRVFALSNPAGSIAPFIDSTNETWGFQSIGVSQSPYTGKGTRIAVLDTGLDVHHPGFQHVRFGGVRSFISERSVDDNNGHGTHCVGTICGPRMPDDAPGYGVAPDAEMYVGKVLDREGNGSERSVLAGINWAIANSCHVISLSLGSNAENSQAFEHVGQRAAERGTVVVAAAGNDSSRSDGAFGVVNRPANSRSILAVGAIDHSLQVANFSARSSKVAGGEVDIVGPGVEVFSAWPLPLKYRGVSGTSMSTPFVVGVAALYAEAYNLRGFPLWERILADAMTLPSPVLDVGVGLVQAPR